MQPGDLIDGRNGARYRLEHRLGAGGMKEVWRAVGPDGPVALAIVRDFDPDRFRNEVMLAARVRDRHVAAVLDGFVADGRGVVVSELCDGVDLGRHLRAAPLGPGQALRLAGELAAGLAAIHAAHVLHRDVKPANAILTGDGVKVIDFGISLAALDDHTGVGRLVAPAGTLPYMAPETLRGDVDARTDAYALGVTVHELVCGRLPLPAVTPYQLLQRLEQRTPLPLDGLAGHDPRVGALVARLVEVERDRRPFVADVVDELAGLAVELADAAPPPRRSVTVDVPAVAPTVIDRARSGEALHPVTLRLPAAVLDPGRVVVGWPHAPIVALVSVTALGAPGATRVIGFDAGGGERWSLTIADDLLGGLVADLDGDGVGELYVWSGRRVYGFDAGGGRRMVAHVTVQPGPMPWDRGPPEPVVVDGPGGMRQLVVGGQAIDVITGRAEPVAARYQGLGDALIDAAGTAGLSCHGAARQWFRGDQATPAAILARRGRPGFVVAALDRVFGRGPRIDLGLWGPGGRALGRGEVGTYDLLTAPVSEAMAALDPATSLFDRTVAPLAVLGDSGDPADDRVVVPYLINAPWFGPVVVGFDGTGAERWRHRVAPRAGQPAGALLADLDGRGPELIWNGAGALQRVDVRTGMPRDPVAVAGVPVAALDLAGQGRLHLVVWTPHDLVVVAGGPCLPGAVAWLPPRGDLWRSGTLGRSGLPVGPRL